VDHYGSFSKIAITCMAANRGNRWAVADDRSYIADLVWLATSSAVDLVLSMVLSLELWWARRKLAAKGGMMAKVTWQLLVSILLVLSLMRTCEHLADVLADYISWWDRSHRPAAHGIIPIPISIKKRSSILLSSYPIRTSSMPRDDSSADG